jgi:hypothetical protein
MNKLFLLLLIPTIGLSQVFPFKQITKDSMFIDGIAESSDLDLKADLSDFQTLESNVVYRTDLDGGWFYPDWFSWSFSQKADGVADSVTSVTNSDVVLTRSVYDSQAGSWDIDWSGVRTSDFSIPEVSSSDEAVATAGEYHVYYVSAGTATVTAAVGDFSRSTNLVMGLVSPLTNDTPTACVTGSAVCAFAEGIDSRLTDGTDMAVYSTQDHTATNYVRNTESWVADIDLTCLSPWNSSGDSALALATGLDMGAFRAGTLIGSDCILHAAHYGIPWQWYMVNPPATTIRFVTSDNRVITRSVVAWRKIGMTDFLIAKLSSPISTNDCRPALLLPENETDFMPYGNYYDELRPGLFIDQRENAHVGNLIILNTYSHYRASTNATRSLYWKFPIVGDSGSPMLLIAPTGLPIITGTFYLTIGGPSVGNENTAIRSAAAVLGCDTNSIVDADFEAMGFTNFNPGAPTP